MVKFIMSSSFWDAALILGERLLEGAYMRFYFGWNEAFSIPCLVNFFYLFTWNTPKWNSLWVFFNYGYFGRKHYPEMKHLRMRI